MLGQFGDDYRPYMERTGMFLPKPVEAAVGRLLPLRSSSLRAALVLELRTVCAVGSAFVLRLLQR